MGILKTINKMYGGIGAHDVEAMEKQGLDPKSIADRETYKKTQALVTAVEDRESREGRANYTTKPLHYNPTESSEKKG